MPCADGRSRIDFDAVEHQCISGEATSFLRKPVRDLFRDGPGGSGNDRQSFLLGVQMLERNEGATAEFRAPIKQPPEPSATKERLQNETRRTL